MPIDYEKVKNYIKASMPVEYLNGEAVTIRYISGPCPENKINWAPWRNEGEMLPVQYRFYWASDANNPNARSIKLPKGYTWIIKYLSDAYRQNDTDILPAAFIYLFVRDALDRTDYDVKEDLSLSSKGLPSLFEASRNELLEKGYSIPDNHCKRFMDFNLEVLMCLSSGKKVGEKLIADIILSSVQNMTKRYTLVEDRYSDEEYERIKNLNSQRHKNVAHHVANAWTVYRKKQ